MELEKWILIEKKTEENSCETKEMGKLNTSIHIKCTSIKRNYDCEI
jgi:hypothetical protein